MKTLLLTGLLTISAALFLSMPASAQIIGTNSFFNNAWTWATSPNTNLAWTATSFEAADGVVERTGVSAANYLRLQYDLADGLNLGADAQFYGLGSAFNQAQAQAGYALVRYYSFKVDGDLAAGWDSLKGAAIVEPKLVLENKITEVTFLEASIGLPWESKGKFQSMPNFYVGMGFCIDRMAGGGGLLGMHKKLFNLIPL